MTVIKLLFLKYHLIYWLHWKWSPNDGGSVGSDSYLIIEPVLLNSVAGSESARRCVGGGGGVDCKEEEDRWDWGVEHIFRTLVLRPSNTCKDTLNIFTGHRMRGLWSIICTIPWMFMPETQHNTQQQYRETLASRLVWWHHIQKNASLNGTAMS